MKLLRKTSGLLLLLPLLSGCDFFDAKIVTACETVLKERLQSPSEYKRIEITRSEAGLSRAEFQNYLTRRSFDPVLRDDRLRRYDEGTEKPMRYALLIEYDAPNAYGTLVRGVSRCEYIALGGDDSNANALSVSVDGETKTDWLRKQL